MPFVLAVKEIRHTDASASLGGNGGSDLAVQGDNGGHTSTEPGATTINTPGDFSPEGLKTLTEQLIAGLRDARVFTEVIAAGDKSGPEPDLELQLSFEGHDFGERRIDVGGAFLSVGVWLFVGPVAWLVRDSHYPESTVRLNVALIDPCRPDGPLFQDKLVLTELPLTFTDRFTLLSCCLNILIPAFLLEGTAEGAGRSLAGRSIDRFLSEGVGRLATLLPGDYQEANASYMFPDPLLEGQVIVISTRALDEIKITCDSSGVLAREVTPDDSAVRMALPLEEIVIQYARAAELERIDHAYRVKLEEGEVGLVRVNARTTNQMQGRWTIRRIPGEARAGTGQ